MIPEKFIVKIESFESFKIKIAEKAKQEKLDWID